MKPIKWASPNFNHEWKTEGMRYYLPDLVDYNRKSFWGSKKEFIEIMNTGSEVELKRDTIKKICNHTHTKRDWEWLDEPKKQRALAAFEKGEVELPIVLNFQGKLYLLGGNTRLNYAANNGYEAKAWLVNMPKK